VGRSLLACLAGLVLGSVVIGVVEFVGHQIYPPPAGIDPRDPESIRRAMETISMGALLVVLVAWAIGSVVGGLVAARLAPRQPMRCALIVGAMLLLAGIANLIMLPHPLWFSIVAVLLFLPAAWLGGRLARAKGGV